MLEPIAIFDNQRLRYTVPIAVLAKATDHQSGKMRPEALASVLEHAQNQSTDILEVEIGGISQDPDVFVIENAILRVVSTEDDAYFEWISVDGDALSPPFYELDPLPTARALFATGLPYPIQFVFPSSSNREAVATDADCRAFAQALTGTCLS